MTHLLTLAAREGDQLPRGDRTLKVKTALFLALIGIAMAGSLSDCFIEDALTAMTGVAATGVAATLMAQAAGPCCERR